MTALATIGARSAPLLALPPLVRAIVAHVHDHDASIAVHTGEAARLFGVAPEALDAALRAALASDGLAVLVGGLQAENDALRAELADAQRALADLTAGVARTSEEAAEAASETSRAMRSVFASERPTPEAP